MIAAAWAALASSALLLLGDLVNRRVRGWMPDDPPRPGRKLHARPIPLAGVLLAPAIAPWLVAERDVPALVALTVATAVGFLDDHGKERGHDLDWRWKALGLAVAAAAAATAIVSPARDPVPWCVLFLFAFVLTNATNFLDNTDGVATGLGAAMLLSANGGVHGTSGIAAAGFAAVGFLPWNWPRPRLFLGDAGAYALGVLAAIAIGRLVVVDVRALWLAALPLVDFTQVVAARLWLGLPPWVGDRRHLTHVVQNLGLQRWLCAPLFTAAAVGLALLA